MLGWLPSAAAVALPPSSGEGALQAGRVEQGSPSCLDLSQSVHDKYKCNARRSVAILKLPRTGSTWLVHALQHGQSAALGSAPARLSRLLWAVWHSQEEAGPPGAQPLPRVLERAASKAADLTAFGLPLPTSEAVAGRPVGRPLPWEHRAAQSRQACPEEAQGLSRGTAQTAL